MVSRILFLTLIIFSSILIFWFFSKFVNVCNIFLSSKDKKGVF